MRTTRDAGGSARRLVGSMLTALLLVPSHGTASASEARQLASGLLAQLAETAKLKASLSPAQRKVDSEIRRHARPEATLQGRAAPPLAESSEAPWRKEGRVRVIVKVTGTASAHAAALQAAGLEIEIVNDRFGLVQGWIADGVLPALADLAIVQSISPALPAEHSAGSVTSEGDHASRADLVRQLGYDGTGVVVGVISGGIDSLANAQATGDLGPVTVPALRGCQRKSGNDEGTAMLEIIHDLAPGVSLLFSSDGDTALGFIDAINCLKEAGADVIVDDLVFFSEPAFEDGPIAQTVREAVQAGVSYFTSAGNFAQVHVEQPYCPGPDALHDFGCGTGAVAVGLNVPPGSRMICFLQWNDRFGASANDYDLLAVDSFGDSVDASLNVQNGTQDPFELVTWTNPFPFTVGIAVGIVRYSGATGLLDLFCPGPSEEPGSLLLVTPTPGGSILGHAGVPEVVSVAAVDVATPGLATIESYSSQGPATVFFPAPDTRAKPDVASFDDVSTTVPGFIPFRGTSAAAPHAAAIAALLLSKNPNLTPAQVQSILTSTAVDIEVPGFDSLAGHGRIDALAAINAVTAPTTTTTTPGIATTTIPRASTTTMPSGSSTTTSTTLAACNPDDCDDNVCTVGDTCVGAVCQPGALLTAGQLSGFVRDDTNLATAECAGDRRKSVKKVAKPLMQAARLLEQANQAGSGRKFGKTLSQARRVARQSSAKLATERARLSSRCLTAFDATIAAASTGLSCLH